MLEVGATPVQRESSYRPDPNVSNHENHSPIDGLAMASLYPVGK